jgi:hypothetical protein
MSEFSLDRYKSKAGAQYEMREGKRIEVETLPPKTPAREKRARFEAWAQTPAEWIKRLKGQSGAAHDLANYILQRDFECWVKKSGDIILSTAATGIPGTTRRKAVKVLTDAGLIAVEQYGKQAFKVTRLFFLPPRPPVRRKRCTT